MIKSIKLVNFRNFKEKELFLDEDKNFIIGNNGKGKTNILEAISLLGGSNMNGLKFENLCNKNSNYFFIEATNHNNKKISISYDIKSNKKKYIVNKKIVNKKTFIENSYSCVIFSPIIMNIMYLSPSLRRDFLDEILINSYPEYNKKLKNYKDIVKNRNKVLKNIGENKSNKNEILFWNKQFINIAIDIYKYRFKIVDYIELKINNFINIFNNKIDNISFKYITKVNKNNIQNDLKNYLKNNLDRDIILKKTYIGPHIDDFTILIDNFTISDFASRGEIKSIILGLKKLEIDFIQEKSNKKPILIIDDLLSELDKEHENILLNNIDCYQTFITSIRKNNNFNNVIKL